MLCLKLRKCQAAWKNKFGFSLTFGSCRWFQYINVMRLFLYGLVNITKKSVGMFIEDIPQQSKDIVNTPRHLDHKNG